jgi:hypothetical protein
VVATEVGVVVVVVVASWMMEKNNCFDYDYDYEHRQLLSIFLVADSLGLHFCFLFSSS